MRTPEVTNGERVSKGTVFLLTVIPALSSASSAALPVISEPEKCEEWRWFDLANLPRKEILWNLSEIDSFLEKRTFLDHS